MPTDEFAFPVDGYVTLRVGGDLKAHIPVSAGEVIELTRDIEPAEELAEDTDPDAGVVVEFDEGDA